MFITEKILYLLIILIVFALTVLVLRKLIPFLKSKKLGQPILEIGPRWHKNKEGTPTMGGLSFIIASAAAAVPAGIYFGFVYGGESIARFVMTLAYAVLCGAIGFIDDLAKLRKKQNEGLTAPQKFALQVLAAALYLAAMCYFGGVTTRVAIPFTAIEIDLGIFFYLFAMLLLVGIDNSVNLTDGIDGLASSITVVVALFFGLVSVIIYEKTNVSLALLSSLMIGSCAGFLVYNFYPARVFMGDTGSLFLGAMVAGCAFVMDNPLIVVIAGFVYITETLSVMLQVGYFKLTHGKRLFKMAPIHHHFEKCGLNEVTITVTFTAVTALLCILSWFALGSM